jgi:hypothetical protein
VALLCAMPRWVCLRCRLVRGGDKRLEADPAPIDAMVGNEAVGDIHSFTLRQPRQPHRGPTGGLAGWKLVDCSNVTMLVRIRGLVTECPWEKPVVRQNRNWKQLCDLATAKGELQDLSVLLHVAASHPRANWARSRW